MIQLKQAFEMLDLVEKELDQIIKSTEMIINSQFRLLERVANIELKVSLYKMFLENFHIN
jgi:hypothetical protein